ncbi:7173_t:CDS:1, partial [Dentiscutata heterogama]
KQGTAVEKKVKCSYKWCELYEAKRYGHTSHNSYECWFRKKEPSLKKKNLNAATSKNFTLVQEEEGWGLSPKNPPFP